jgi:serine/threonine-protein kinase
VFELGFGADENPSFAETAASPTSGGEASADSSPQSDWGRFLPGARLAGRYRIVSPLGRGGMGEVYRADDLKLGQPVALKFLPQRLERDKRLLARFLNEVRTARQVSHPNVCRVYDIGEVDGQHFLSMEYVDGEDLASLLRRIGRVPRDKAVQIARQICAGLAAVHDQGILHRDLKPANVMIDGRGRAKIADFGLAAVADADEGREVRAGTPAYMAPEQFAGAQLTARTDLYALGLLLYELFTGKPAFEGESLSVERRHVDSVPTDPTSLVEDLDPAVGRVILRCLEHEPADRPASALSVSASLPGGDPLAAALAEGETPPPDVVAAAGGKSGLPLWAIVLCLFVAVLGLGLKAVMFEKTHFMGRVPFDLSPERLAIEANDFVVSLGYDDPPFDRAYALGSDRKYIEHIRFNEPPDKRWDDVGTVQPTAFHFWYRQGPAPLQPKRWRGGIRYADPPMDVPGMIRVVFDTQSRLTAFLAVPPVFDEATDPVSEPDFTALLERSGLDLASLSPAEPMWNPLVNCDRRAAWTGTYPGQTDIRMRAEACAYRGRPIYFGIHAPWTPREEGPPKSMVKELGLVGVLILVLFLLIFALFVAGAMLARRNLRMGRGDKRGALRIASISLVLQILVWASRAHHVPFPIVEMDMWIQGVASALMLSVILWIVYIALEPYLRRMWPESLISWSRLLAGRFRDPRVGRDILLGATAGLVLITLHHLHWLVTEWFAFPVPYPEFGSFNAVLGTFRSLALIPDWLTGAVMSSIFVLLAVLIARLVVRKQWVAVAIMIGFFVLLRSMSDAWLWSTPAGVVRVAFSLGMGLVIFGVAIRLGLLAMIAMFWFRSLDGLPLPIDLSLWFAGKAWMVAALMLAVTFYAAYLAGTGRRLFRDRLFES